MALRAARPLTFNVSVSGSSGIDGGGLRVAATGEARCACRAQQRGNAESVVHTHKILRLVSADGHRARPFTKLWLFSEFPNRRRKRGRHAGTMAHRTKNAARFRRAARSNRPSGSESPNGPYFINIRLRAAVAVHSAPYEIVWIGESGTVFGGGPVVGLRKRRTSGIGQVLVESGLRLGIHRTGGNTRRFVAYSSTCLLYTSPSPRDTR